MEKVGQQMEIWGKVVHQPTFKLSVDSVYGKADQHIMHIKQVRQNCPDFWSKAGGYHRTGQISSDSLFERSPGAVEDHDKGNNVSDFGIKLQSRTAEL